MQITKALPAQPAWPNSGADADQAIMPGQTPPLSVACQMHLASDTLRMRLSGCLLIGSAFELGT